MQSKTLYIMKRVGYLQIVAIFAMLLIGCGQRKFTIPQANYDVITVGEGDSLKYILNTEIPEDIQLQFLCSVIDGDTVIHEYQRFNPVIGEFEPFRTYLEPKNFREFISALPDYKKAIEAIPKLQKAYDVNRAKIRAEEAKYVKYLEDTRAWEERVKNALPIIIANNKAIYESNPYDHFERIRYEQATSIMADMSDYDGELLTKKETNEYGAEITYTYYIENGKEVKHGTYTCIANLNHVTYRPNIRQASYDLTGAESVTIDYRRGIIHGRIIYDCDLEIINNHNNSKRHETEHFVHYVYKGRLDGDINLVTRGFSYKGYALGSIARKLSATGNLTGVTELKVSDEGKYLTQLSYGTFDDGSLPIPGYAIDKPKIKLPFTLTED